MLRTDLLKILICPETRMSLSVAPVELVNRLNVGIAKSLVRNRANQVLDKPLDAGLLRADEKVLYPIRDEIPLLLIDEAIPLDQEAARATAS